MKDTLRHQRLALICLAAWNNIPVDVARKSFAAHASITAWQRVATALNAELELGRADAVDRAWINWTVPRIFHLVVGWRFVYVTARFFGTRIHWCSTP